MDAFPAFFPLAGRTIAVVGDGEPAEAKARLFDGSPARLLRIEAGRALDPAAYDDASLVFVAAGDVAFREAAAKVARQAGAVVNVVDHPALSDFHTPALVDRGAVVAAVGTTGASPMLAALLRSDIEARIPPGAGRVAALFGAMRERLREALPDLDARRAFLREALTGAAAEAAMVDDMGLARRLLGEALDAWGARAPTRGRLRIVVGDGAADLLSLRAARALAQADVLIADQGASPATLALARREARRVSLEGANLEALAGFAEQGLQIVWVGTPALSLIEALAAKGVAIEQLRSAPA
ncbi:MAG TPA: bifunctional precorrin-2 dehydrogenase/sirohydrochlorin ferrochelatase [Caulobacteraceae bacterium]|jgi:precorrin-2 dehydrogenase/sirohydrochlorin ferrochelatase|nr:bifunctional precorrin-2 dehydrogenase/sirohydrochlorin ferrochelatase [Caulobacteraceae bacterium]